MYLHHHGPGQSCPPHKEGGEACGVWWLVEGLGGQVSSPQTPLVPGGEAAEEFQPCVLVSHCPGFRAATRQQGLGDPCG